MKLRRYGKILKWVFPFTVPIFLSSCNSSAAILNSKGYIGLQQCSLILTAFSLMLIVVIPAIIMAVVFSWRYRSSNVYAKYSPDWSYSKKIEVLIWTVPILIILFLIRLTWKTTHSLEPSKLLSYYEKPITIEVISMDWKWFFIYPEQDIATVNEIAFPVNVPVRFEVTSNSVMNSFFIPRLGSQIYAMAGMKTNLNLIANESGIYDGISANYSGHGFSGMKFKAIATPDRLSFNQWIKKVKQSQNTVNDISTFEKIAIPSEFNKVEYFSGVQSNLFRNVINKFIDNDINRSNLIKK